MAKYDDVDMNTLGNGPWCPKCGGPQNVAKLLTEKVRARSRNGIPLPYKVTIVPAWLCTVHGGDALYE